MNIPLTLTNCKCTYINHIIISIINPQKLSHLDSTPKLKSSQISLNVRYINCLYRSTITTEINQLLVYFYMKSVISKYGIKYIGLFQVSDLILTTTSNHVYFTIWRDEVVAKFCKRRHLSGFIHHIQEVRVSGDRVVLCGPGRGHGHSTRARLTPKQNQLLLHGKLLITLTNDIHIHGKY